MDSSLIEANASNNSIVNREALDRYLREGYQEFERRLEEEADKEDDDEGKGQINRRHISMTDPETICPGQDAICGGHMAVPKRYQH